MTRASKKKITLRYQKNLVLFDGWEFEGMKRVIIPLPKPPSDHSKIDGWNLPVEEQYWKPPVMPPEVRALDRMNRNALKKEIRRLKKLWSEFLELPNLARRNAPKTLKNAIAIKRWVDEEWRRRREGYWFMNNGTATYITGLNYTYLGWWRCFEGLLPDYRSNDRGWFLFWDDCVKDSNCHGMVEVANRRSGKTAKGAFVMAEYATGTFYAHCGMQSKTHEDVKKLFKLFIVRPWQKLPFFFSPEFDTSTSPKEELLFQLPTEKGKKNINVKVDREGKELQSMITTAPSIDIAYDGSKLLRYLADEEGKTTLTDVNDRWMVVRKCLEVGGEIIGKSIHTTTTELFEKNGLIAFKKQWDNSHPDTIGENNRTKSGLRQYFTPAHHCRKFDKYGNSLKKESLKDLQDGFDQHKDNPNELAKEQRKEPITLRMALRMGSGDSMFNSIIINERLDDFMFGNPKLVPGNFQWMNGELDTAVEWVPNPNGRFEQSGLPPSELRNNVRLMGNNLVPMNEDKFSAGADPYKFSETEGNKPSDGAGAIFRKFDLTVDNLNDDPLLWESHRFVCTYSSRPRDLDTYYEDMIKMCFFYGAPMFLEINVPGLMEYFDRRGYGSFLTFRPKKGRNNPVNPGQTTTEPLKQLMFGEVEKYIEEHGRREYHTKFLQQCLEVTPKNMTKHDLFTACGYALMGSLHGYKTKKPIDIAPALGKPRIYGKFRTT